MYGYTQQPYGNFTSAGYTSTAGNQVYNPQQQQQQPQAGQLAGLGQTTNVAASNVYSSANYPYSTNTAASAYANYGQTATQNPSSLAGYGKFNNLFLIAFVASTYKAPTPSSYVGVTRIGTASTLGSLGQQTSLSGGITSTAGSNYGVGTKSSATGAGNHYAGYEAAVYAAASSYLQAKTTGQTNVWMSKKGGAGGGGGGAGSFPRKRYGIGANVTQHYCEVCKITCAGQQTYNEHLQGQRHKKKEAANKDPAKQSLPRNKVSFKCDICNVTCTGRDTYDAHVKGGKHQKTMSLMKKMGKTVPTEPTLIPPKEPYGAPIPTVGGASVPTKKVVGVTATKFVGGSRLTTTGVEESTNSALEEALAAEKNIQPVGEEYVETKNGPNGKLIEYFCKLCDCKFTDPNAKNIHLKGRRHRLAYKQKVDPSLKVEMKMGIVRKRREIGSRQLDAQIFRPPPLLHPMMMRPWFGSNLTSSGGRYETMDDKHVLAKVKEIEPNEEEKTNIEKLVSLTEKTLKSISDHFATQNEAEKPKVEGEEQKSADRLLKGVMRVGLLAKNMLLKTDKQVELVVLCSKIPTYTLLKQMAKLFPEFAQKAGDEKPNVTERAAESSLYISLPGNQIICRVTLTCVALRDPETGVTLENPADPLPKEPCLEALAQLRHAKWYQVKCAVLQSITVTMRIIRDISSRVTTWSPLTNWAMELLVEKTLSSIQVPLSPGDAVRRVFEVIASGVILTTNPVLLDPCEKDQIDILAGLTGQQREDITSSAQHALRLIAFNQLYKILAIERLPDERPPPVSANAEDEDVGSKKEKTVE
uniref:DZF domain-containing protein n=1 Tax=Acrobeloides nanus TaxID=290746 RepID=A0A914C074_9BILA